MPELNLEQTNNFTEILVSLLQTHVRGENNISFTPTHSNPVKKTRHIKNIKDNSERQRKCVQCELLFRTAIDFVKHIKSAHWHEKPKWKCEDCGKSYSKKGNLKKHVRKAHSVELQNRIERTVVIEETENFINHKTKKRSVESRKETNESAESAEIKKAASYKKNKGNIGENVSHNDNTIWYFDMNGSNMQTHNEITVEASKDDNAERMEIDPECADMPSDDVSDSNDSNRNDKINSVKNMNLNNSKLQGNRKINVKEVKEGIISDNYQHSQCELTTEQKKRWMYSLGLIPCKIFGEDNNPVDTSEADNESQSKEALQRMQEHDAVTINRDDKSEENGYYDKCNREVQTHIGTAVNNGAVEHSAGDSLESSSNYVTLNDNMGILRGSFHQGNLRFKASRDKQCTGIAAVACAAFCALDPNTWGKSVIDNIVIIGNKYYNDCIAARTSPAAGEVNPEYLAARDLLPTINHYGKNVAVNIHEDLSYNGHIDNDNSTEGFPDLMNVLKIFSRQYTCGILTANAKSVAVYCKAGTVGPTYWMFDSHSRGPEGALALVMGAACSMWFSQLDDLHSMLRRNLFVSPNEVLGGDDLRNSLNVFSLTPLTFKPPH